MSQQVSGPRTREPKVIVVFSDGTGNSAAKLSKTNVWRLYQALDLATPSAGEAAAGAARQIALYDNGVGTSRFRPMALLGGVFGYGLKRNVLDLYKFLCRNYEDGDRIYAFGFSRGAFTIRVLVGMVARIGLVEYEGEGLLASHAQQAYREYRRRFKADNLAGFYRTLRDAAIGGWRRLRGDGGRVRYRPVKTVEFVGVWDTVAAYGTPLTEMTRAVDRWVWPTSMPDYVLSAKVLNARHALALDDERDTFHPVLWDEVIEPRQITKVNEDPASGYRLELHRLRQVWFAGMHSDVGGGYPDNSLSLVSLDWMMDEAAACGLRFRASERAAIRGQKDPLGPIHDSRAGLGTYYRYQPRRLAARLEPPDPSTLLMQDPTRTMAHGRLVEVVVHESVIERIRSGPDGYAPIVLPPRFRVRPHDGTAAHVTLAPGDARIWNLVWRRRVVYFLGLALTLLLLLMPLLPPADCEGPQCLVSHAVSATGAMLPAFLAPWVKAWADNPGWLILLLAAMALIVHGSVRLQRSIDDAMSAIWQRTLSDDRSPSPVLALRGLDPWIRRLRTSPVYQRSLQWLKWRVAPAGFALVFVLVGLVITAVLVQRVPLLWIDVHARYCAPLASAVPVRASQESRRTEHFGTDTPCWSTGGRVDAGVRYRLSLTVVAPWRDGLPPSSWLLRSIPATPEGFPSAEFGVLAPFVAPLKRVIGGRWFQPVITVRDDQGRAHTLPVTVQATEPGGDTYSGTFVAPAGGEAFLFVNDVVLPWWGNPVPRFYHNNLGSAAVALQRLPLEDRD